MRVAARKIRIEIDVHSFDESVLGEVEHAGEAAARRFPAIPRVACAVAPKGHAFDDHLQTARDVSEPITMVRYLQSGRSETRGKLAEFLEPPADAVFREVELEVRREQFVRKPSVVDLFEIRLGEFDQQC